MESSLISVPNGMRIRREPTICQWRESGYCFRQKRGSFHGTSDCEYSL